MSRSANGAGTPSRRRARAASPDALTPPRASERVAGASLLLGSLLLATLLFPSPHQARPPSDPDLSPPLVRVLLRRVPLGGQLQIDLPEARLRSELPTVAAGERAMRRPSRTASDAEAPESDAGAVLPKFKGLLSYREERSVQIGQQRFTLPLSLSFAPGATFAVDGRTDGGSLQMVRSSGRLALIATLPLEDYLPSVVAQEMGRKQSSGALEAQAVASRSFALARMARRGRALWDVDTTQLTQAYPGVQDDIPRARLATRNTSGFVLLGADGKVLEALYSSTCGGGTRSATEAFGGEADPSLRGVPCSYCRGTKHYNWPPLRRPSAQVARALGLGDRDLSGATIREQSEGGWLRRITLAAGSRSKTVDGTTFRRALGSEVKSLRIHSVSLRGRDIEVLGRGFGHGVGLCQYGARTLGNRGADGRTILEHYYPGATLVSDWGHPAIRWTQP